MKILKNLKYNFTIKAKDVDDFIQAQIVALEMVSAYQASRPLVSSPEISADLKHLTVCVAFNDGGVGADHHKKLYLKTKKDFLSEYG